MNYTHKRWREEGRALTWGKGEKHSQQTQVLTPNYHLDGLKQDTPTSSVTSTLHQGLSVLEMMELRKCRVGNLCLSMIFRKECLHLDPSPMESPGFCCPWYQTIVQGKRPQPQHCGHAEPHLSLLWVLSCALGVFSIISPLNASRYPPVVAMKRVSIHDQMFPGGQNHPRLKTTSLGQRGAISHKDK